MLENESQYFLKIWLFDWLHLRGRGKPKGLGFRTCITSKNGKDDRRRGCWDAAGAELLMNCVSDLG